MMFPETMSPARSLSPSGLKSGKLFSVGMALQAQLASLHVLTCKSINTGRGLKTLTGMILVARTIAGEAIKSAAALRMNDLRSIRAV